MGNQVENLIFICIIIIATKGQSNAQVQLISWKSVTTDLPQLHSRLSGLNGQLFLGSLSLGSFRSLYVQFM